MPVILWMRRMWILPIRLYQWTLSPLLGNQCRFQPTCSVYACEAILKTGIVRGTFKAAWRILRCNPFCEGGYDPVIREPSGPAEGKEGRNGAPPAEGPCSDAAQMRVR